MESIKGGFPLPINWHVRNCSSSGKLHKLKRACLLLWRSMAASCATSSQTSWTSKLLQSSAFPHVVPCHRALNFQPHNSGVVSRPLHRPTTSLYSPAVRTPDPEYLLGINIRSWSLCTPSPKLKIFFSRNTLSETKTVFWMWGVVLWVGFFLSPLFLWFSFLSLVPLG